MIYDTLIPVVSCDSFVTNNGNTILTSGLYTDSLTSLNGCDSLVKYNVTINSSYAILVDTTVFCDTLILPNGDSTFLSGLYYDSLQTTSGCDSIITYNVTVTCDIDSDNDGISDLDEVQAIRMETAYQIT